MAQPTVFISYSHKDEEEKDRLLSHLGVLRHAGLIDLWSDDRIGAGVDWEAEIYQAISQANVAVLLISASFLTSDFILNKEVPALLQRRKHEGLTVFPVIAKACAWQKIDWLAKMNARPKNGRPVWRGAGSRIDEDLAAIAEEIAVIVTGESNQVTITSLVTTNVSKESQTELQSLWELQARLDTFADAFQGCVTVIERAETTRWINDASFQAMKMNWNQCKRFLPRLRVYGPVAAASVPHVEEYLSQLETHVANLNSVIDMDNRGQIVHAVTAFDDQLRTFREALVIMIGRHIGARA